MLFDFGRCQRIIQKDEGMHGSYRKPSVSWTGFARTERHNRPATCRALLKVHQGRLPPGFGQSVEPDPRSAWQGKIALAAGVPWEGSEIAQENIRHLKRKLWRLSSPIFDLDFQQVQAAAVSEYVRLVLHEVQEALMAFLGKNSDEFDKQAPDGDEKSGASLQDKTAVLVRSVS